MFMNLEDQVKFQIEEELNKNPNKTDLYKIIADLGPFLAIGNVPLGITVTVLGYAANYIKDKQDLKTVKMPDQWLLDLSHSKDISKEGLAYVATKVSNKGFITGSEALRFLEIESEIKLKDKQEKESSIAIQGQGALAIINKAKKECGNLFVFDAKQVAKSITMATLNGLKVGSDFLFDITKK